MGGERHWRQDFGEVAPDGSNEAEVWDAKCYERFSVIEMYVRAERKYRAWANGRRFHLSLFSRKHPRAGDFVLLKADEYAEDRRVIAALDRYLSGPDYVEHPGGRSTVVISRGALRSMIEEARVG